MLTTFNVDDIVTGARNLTLRDGVNTQVLDASLLVWVNEELRKLWALTARVAPGAITKNKTFSVASGNTQIITAIAGLTDYWMFRGLDFDATNGNGYYTRVKPIHFQSRYRNSTRGFLLYGTTLELYPKTNSTGSYQLWYLYQAPVAVAAGTLLLPIGSEEFIAMGVAAKMRGRAQEDASQYIAGQKSAWETFVRPALALMSSAVAAPQGDVEDGYDW